MAKLVAHRGSVLNSYENSSRGFKKAGKNNDVWGIETDIWKTKDNKFVCVHDYKPFINQKVVVGKIKWSQVKEMPINTAKMSFVTTDALFPTKLNKYLKICKKYKKHPVIELKDKRIDLNYLKILHGTISKYINRNKVYIASFNFKALKLVDDFFADYKTIYLVEKRNSEKSKTAKNALLRKIRKLIKEQKNVGIQPHMVSEELVELAHEYEVKVYVWTVGDEKEYDKLSELDVDFIVQDIG